MKLNLSYRYLSIQYLSVLLFVGTQASAEPLCDLSPALIEGTQKSSNVEGHTIEYQLQTRLTFTGHSNSQLYDIQEVTVVYLPNISTLMKRIAVDRADALSADECGSIISLSKTDVSTEAKNLLAWYNFSVEHWACIVGVRGLLAQGNIAMKLMLSPEIYSNQLRFQPNVTSTNNIDYNGPPVWSDMEATINREMQDQADTTLNGLRDTLRSTLRRIEQAQNDKGQSGDNEGLYTPNLTSARFLRADNNRIALQIVREAQAREGTSCALRKIIQAELTRSN